MVSFITLPLSSDADSKYEPIVYKMEMPTILCFGRIDFILEFLTDFFDNTYICILLNENCIMYD